MDMSQEFMDWALPGSAWPSVDGTFFEPFDLGASFKSDVADFHMFNVDTILDGGSPKSGWPEDAIEILAPAETSGYLAALPVADCVSGGLDSGHMESTADSSMCLTFDQYSPWEELPCSPEDTFCLIDDYSLQRGCGAASPEAPEMCSVSMPAAAAVPEPAQPSVTVSMSDSEVSAAGPMMLLDWDESVNDVIIDPLQLVDIGPILPPVSADDVDSLLSCSSTLLAGSAGHVDLVLSSSSTVLTSSDDIQSTRPYSDDEDSCVLQYSTTAPLSPDLYEVASSPSSSISSLSVPPTEKKRRKKEQNKSAAQRYRQKKRSEQGQVTSEYELLERRNIELRTRVEEMTREVNYLKGLIEEICS